VRKYVIGGSVAALVVFILIVVGLYQLGSDDQSALEKLRDIAVIFIVLLFMTTVILLAGVTAALGFVAFQLRDRIIPLLEELTGTVKQIRGTTTFVSEEAVRPIIGLAGSISRVREMSDVIRGRRKQPNLPKDRPKPPSHQPTTTMP
jgi:hypothetical protein